MAEVSVHSNSPLQSKVAANPHARKPEGFFGHVGEMGRAIFRPLQTTWRYGRYAVAPADNPQDALDRIQTIAQNGLDRAAERGVKVGPEAAQKLFTIEAPSEAETAAVSAVGPVADISPLPSDHRVTRAPNLQARVEDPNHWKKEGKVSQGRLEEKTGAHIALLQMCARSGLKLKDKDYLALMNIVKRFTEGNVENKSLWEFFKEFAASRDVSFIQKMKAGWFYLLYYYTSILTRTIKAYLRPAIKNLTDDLIKDNSDTRSLVFQKIIDNINSFLVADIQATKDFALEKERSDLKVVRDEAIVRAYGSSLPDLCRAFSDKRVNDDNPNVELFETANKIPIIGYLFKGLESLINRFIIRSNMKSWILPNALESVVKTSFDKTQPHNIPFYLNLTRFLTLQLEKLKVELGNNNQGPSAKPPGAFPGTELLGPAIQKLMITLGLEPLGDDAIKLRRKFNEFEKGKWFHDETIEKSIEKGIIDAGNLLFRYLNETARSGELFARLLDLSCAPFSGEETSEEVLEAQFKTEKKKLKDLCKHVGGEIVKEAVAKTVNGQRPEDANKVAYDTFDAGKVTANKALEELNRLCLRMSEKIDRSAHTPTAENNVQLDIANFLQIMKVFASQNEVRQAIEASDLNKVDRDAIWRIVTPLYERAAQIQERMLSLQELQNQYPTHATVEQRLRLINDLFRSIQDQFHTQPRQLQTHLIQTLGVHAEEISKCLGSKAEVTVITQRNIKQVSALTESVIKRQNIIDAIYAFYPPRLNAQETESEGLLDQLLNYERGIHLPGFKKHLCLEEIEKKLEHFSPEDKQELKALIGKGSNLKSKWNQLGATLQRIYQHHMDLKNREQLELDTALDRVMQFTREMILKYSIVKEKDHSKMETEIRVIANQVSSLQNDTLRANLSLPPSLSSKGAKLASGSFCSFLGGGLGWLVAGPVGGVVGSGLGSATGEYLLARPDEKDSRPVLKTLAGVVGSAAAGAVGAAWWPFGALAGTAAAAYAPAAAAAGSIYAGWHAKKAVQSVIQDHVQKKVLDIFSSAYTLCLDPRIYKAATTRTLIELAKA